MSNLKKNNSLLTAVKKIIIEARKVAWHTNNSILLNMYWQIGQLIVDDEQGGQRKADYGKAVLKNLATQLTLEFGRGFDESNLRNIRQFYLSFPFRDAVRHELSRTHYRIISRLENQSLRDQYVRYAIEKGWNTRTLQRNIDSQYLNRVLEIPKTTQEPLESKHIIKDPYILEFLGIPTGNSLTIAGSAGIASTFSWLEPARPYLVGITVAVLEFAWYQKLIPFAKTNPSPPAISNCRILQYHSSNVC